jgi:hypothetical protein
MIPMAPRHAQTNIQHAVRNILRTGKITRVDERLLHGAMRSEGLALSSEDLLQVREVMDRLQWGLLKVVE